MIISILKNIDQMIRRSATMQYFDKSKVDIAEKYLQNCDKMSVEQVTNLDPYLHPCGDSILTTKFLYTRFIIFGECIDCVGSRFSGHYKKDKNALIDLIKLYDKYLVSNNDSGCLLSPHGMVMDIRKHVKERNKLFLPAVLVIANIAYNVYYEIVSLYGVSKLGNIADLSSTDRNIWMNWVIRFGKVRIDL